ncbi:2-polyprenyl-6-methoxyphenol hydroxylase [Pseudoxanthomonas broegbernensis]|uniref:Alkyl hydroperoxide reductase subunit F n=1 Tax=Pseudoxanthomonas broegbernensis TaxID=83619 RepID=A0A7V8GL27_9GAMM|nr:FAD-dependent oxidoreductase [Pseudoxanthomonas broegbernensis]KAF1685453.1 2-polyprenyl-6-methoxyphenol hydroxylase [Pseudoxanthomonas broegbernensis]MBB6064416.1 2-polyprenyl-6-methoxyphenol hydroxylase-like FAD-dependent oxidoreductase [Pseudoxanthomonas broegbernensis]
MAHRSTTDVLVCGAGAAGLTLAIELARRGVRFRLVEKRATPFPGSRGKGIQPRTQEILEDMGILDRAVAAGGLYPPLRAYRDDGGWTDADIAEHAGPTPAEPYRLPLMVPQWVTERLMRERLAELGHRVELGCELLGFEQDRDGVAARLAGPAGEETVHARYLVGADGGRSFVRKALGVDFPGKTLGVRALVADVVLTGLDRDAWHQFNGGDMARTVAICPLAGTGLFQIQAPIPPDAQADLSAEGLGALVAERTGRTDILVRSVSWASDYQMNARLAERYRVGRVFLAGDAAHAHPPTGGQGLNTSLQDAYNLGWKLAAALKGAREDLLDSYEAERRPVAEAMLGLSTRLLDAQKQGRMRRGREVLQLDIGYPDSPLSKETPARTGGLRAGDRAPDAPVRGAAGQATRLFRLFQGTHWTLLAHEAGDALVEPRPGLHVHRIGAQGEVADAWGHVRDAYALAPGACALIRPDGYVGAIFDAERTAKLEAYLARMGVARLEEASR